MKAAVLTSQNEKRQSNALGRKTHCRDPAVASIAAKYPLGAAADDSHVIVAGVSTQALLPLH